MKRWIDLVVILVTISLAAYFWQGPGQPLSLPLAGKTLHLWAVNEAGLKLAQESAATLRSRCGAECPIQQVQVSEDAQAFDQQRGQWSADRLLQVYGGTLKEGEHALLVLEEDLYTPSQPGWAFCYGVHGQSLSVLSRSRLQRPGHWDKMLCRYSIVRVLGQRTSDNPQSLFFSPVLGPGDVEQMQLRFDL